MTAQENAAVVRRFAEKVITEGHIDSARDFVWEDVVEQVPLPGQVLAWKVYLVFSIDEQIAEGDKVASRFEWTGTHKGEFLGVPATGCEVRVWGVVIDRLEQGRIKDTRLIMDSLD